MGIRGLLVDLLEIYEVIIILEVVMSWFPISNPGGPMHQFRGLLHRFTEPVLGPIRRLIPSTGGSSLRFDFSPLIVILLIQLLLIPILGG
ncbi:MAG: YggT family protein [Ferrimicrobium sp.]